MSASLRPADVLHVLGTAEHGGVGIARIVAALASGLDPSKYRLHACFLGPEGPLVEYLRRAGARSCALNWCRGARDPVGAYRFWRQVKEHDFSIIHLHQGSRAARGIARTSSKARFILHLHGCIDEDQEGGNPKRPSGAHAVIAAAHAIARQHPSDTLEVLHAGVELAQDVDRSHAFAQRPIVIGTACRLVARKGILDLIRAFELVRAEVPLQLEIAGDGSEQVQLEREVQTRGLADRVRFLGWQDNLDAVYSAWDIFAFPSHDEGLPISVLEAMAAGLPVVGTSVGGIPELIVDGLTGYVVSPSSISELAARLHLLVADAKRRTDMGTAGRQRVRDHFSAERMVAQVSALYQSLDVPR